MSSSRAMLRELVSKWEAELERNVQYPSLSPTTQTFEPCQKFKDYVDKFSLEENYSFMTNILNVLQIFALVSHSALKGAKLKSDSDFHESFLIAEGSFYFCKVIIERHWNVICLLDETICTFVAEKLNLPYESVQTTKYSEEFDSHTLLDIKKDENSQNRQKVTDEFYALFRQSSALDRSVSQLTKLKAKVSEFMSKIFKSNICWFADLFYHEYLRCTLVTNKLEQRLFRNGSNSNEQFFLDFLVFADSYSLNRALHGKAIKDLRHSKILKSRQISKLFKSISIDPLFILDVLLHKDTFDVLIWLHTLNLNFHRHFQEKISTLLCFKYSQLGFNSRRNVFCKLMIEDVLEQIGIVDIGYRNVVQFVESCSEFSVDDLSLKSTVEELDETIFQYFPIFKTIKSIIMKTNTAPTSPKKKLTPTLHSNPQREMRKWFIWRYPKIKKIIDFVVNICEPVRDPFSDEIAVSVDLDAVFSMFCGELDPSVIRVAKCILMETLDEML